MRQRFPTALRRCLVLLPAMLVPAAVGGLLVAHHGGNRRLVPLSVANADANCMQLAREFTDYPLVFPGAEFQGLPLTGCQRSRTRVKFDLNGNVREPATNHFAFVYGSCTPEPDAGCAPPVQVIVDPPCGPTLSDAVKQEKANVRGQDVSVKIDGSIRIEGESFKASVFAFSSDYEASKQKALQVAETLHGANDLAASLEPGSALDTSLQAAPVC